MNAAREVSGTVALRCNWAAATLPGAHDGLRVTKVVCIGRVHAGLIMQAVEQGAGEVLVIGCPEDECRHQNGVRLARTQVQIAQNLLRLLGLDSCSIRLVAGTQRIPGVEDSRNPVPDIEQ
jgi:coenzyme F420-reducing hydrogenase delta subunit